MSTIPTLYRLTLRSIRSHSRQHPSHPPLRLTYPLSLSSYGTGSHTTSTILSHQRYISSKFKALVPARVLMRMGKVMTDTFTHEELNDLVGNCYRTVVSSSSSSSKSENITDALSGYTLLLSQLRLHSSTSVSLCTVTNLRITATSTCVGVEGVRGTFAYRITIENLNQPEEGEREEEEGRRRLLRSRGVETQNDKAPDGNRQYPPHTYKLLGRSWTLRTSCPVTPLNQIDQPTTGVVGLRPVIQPRETFEYISGTDIVAPGTMGGGLFFRKMWGKRGKKEEELFVKISDFGLSV